MDLTDPQSSKFMLMIWAGAEVLMHEEYKVMDKVTDAFSLSWEEVGFDGCIFCEQNVPYDFNHL